MMFLPAFASAAKIHFAIDRRLIVLPRIQFSTPSALKAQKPPDSSNKLFLWLAESNDPTQD